MSARLTVVLDDESLYRDLKVRAAREGVPLKRLVEEAIREFLESGGEEGPAFSWDAFQQWQQAAAALEAEIGPSPEDLSDVKHHLYGWPRRQHMVAEDRAQYDRE